MRKRRIGNSAGWFAAAALAVGLVGCTTPPPARTGQSETLGAPLYVQPFNGVDLGGWRNPVGNWGVVGLAVANPFEPTQISVSPGSGVLVNGLDGRTSNLLTVMEHGDVEVHLEFMVPKNSNSGVYLQGRYEVQILDSWGDYEPSFAACGGIYQRWANGEGFEGYAPRVNASLPPGDWQRFDILFRAPRFNEQGVKVENARFVEVMHNGVKIHENVEVTGPTRSAAFFDESPAGPLMLQGDHGPIAYRNLVLRHVFDL